jgi:hypothetical protein
MAQTLTKTETSLDYAGSTAINADGSIFDSLVDLAPYRLAWQQRCSHYSVLRSYYNGTVYDEWPELVRALKLYSGIRQIFGPLRRAVRVDVAKVPGGWAMPDSAPTPLVTAVTQVRTWSSWRATYSRAVQHGAVAGEFGLLVCDDQANRRVQIVALRPDEVVLGELSDGTPFGLVIKPGLVDRYGRYEYAQLITPTQISLYRSGQLQLTQPNMQGRVPLLLSPYIAGENGIGENAFAGTQELLDRVNDATSQALDVIQRNAEPLTIFSGVSEVDFDPENNAITLSKADAKAYTLAPNLAIDHAIALIDKVLGEFKNLLPQLIFDDLRSRNDLAYDTVLTLCGELIDHVGDVRTHVDAAVVQAERWALEAGQQMGLFGALPLEAHALDEERAVIQPTPGQKLALEAQKKALETPTPAPGQQQPAQGQQQPAQGQQQPANG